MTVRHTDSKPAWTCTRCNGPLQIYERAQPGLPSYCTPCLRANQLRPAAKTDTTKGQP